MEQSSYYSDFGPTLAVARDLSSLSSLSIARGGPGIEVGAAAHWQTEKQTWWARLANYLNRLGNVLP